MRFKGGSRVEVMIKDDTPISWRPAEIISGNGHTYYVKYDPHPSIRSEAVMERVPRKAVRPCPPVECPRSWVAGDVVEVFYHRSWKIAALVKAVGVDFYLVRLLGSTQEFKVHRLYIRIRQSWQDNKWVTMGKASAGFRDNKSERLSTSDCFQKASFKLSQANVRMKLHSGDEKNGVFQESLVVSSRTLKRASPFCSSVAESCTGNARKARAIEKESGRRRGAQTELREKVDAVFYPKEALGEKYIHASVNGKSVVCYELGGEKLSDAIGGSLARSPRPNDCDTCSIGSCSITSESPNKLHNYSVPFPRQGEDMFFNDEESCYGLGIEEENCSLSPEEEVAASIHELELHAYRCTLLALRASGPISWEKEAVLTNLRIALHISNDEHLKELRNLISSRTGCRDG